MLFLKLLNGCKMPALGLGTWQATERELEITLENALEIGYRHFDTAILYQNEGTIGKVLNKWLDAGKLKRQELFVTTKLPPTGMYADKVEHYLRKSLENLKLDYIDLYLIHSPDGIMNTSDDTNNVTQTQEIEMDKNVDHISVWKKLEQQVKAGFVKSIGVSNFSMAQVENLVKKCEIKPANVQVELHVYHQQKALVKFCKDHGISVVAYSPLGSPGLNNFYSAYGVTYGLFPSPEIPCFFILSDFRKDIPNLLANETVGRIADKHGKTAAQILLRHIVQRGLGAVPKTTNLQRLKENISIFDFSLDHEDMDDLNGLDLGNSGSVNEWESWTWM